MENIDFILLIKHFIIGIVQGLTEPIPVSSSGHVMIASEILGLGEQGFMFAILTNTASLLAILFIYREDIIRLITGFLLYIKTDALKACLCLFNDQGQTNVTQTNNADYQAAVFDFLEHGLFHNVIPL